MRNRCILVVVMVFLFSCGIKKPSEIFFNNDGKYKFIGSKYFFTDKTSRNISLNFLNDTTLIVENVSNISHSYHVFDYKVNYRYQILDYRTLIITSSRSTNKTTDKSSYLKPYENKPFMLDSNAIKFVFPNIQNDTLRFGENYAKLQIREFNFDLVK